MKPKKSHIRIDTPAGGITALMMRSEKTDQPVPGLLWLHGGGYVTGMAAMVHFTMGHVLAEHFGCVLIAPNYRLALKHPYPAALEDSYAALRYLYDHAEELGVDRNRIIVGGESAGGGLAAAVCICARDRGEIPVSFQIPLYPMLDCEDTDSSRHSHSHGWGTRRNHWGWRKYLREMYGTDKVPAWASPSRETDYAGLPPCYTYVEDNEPFHDETVTYVKNLREAGVEAQMDIFHGNIHGFDAMTWTKNAKAAKQKLLSAAEKYMGSSYCNEGKDMVESFRNKD